MSKNGVIVALDVGTTKICVIVGEINQDGVLKWLGMGHGISRGLRKGIVVDIEAAGSDIRAAVEQASQSTGIEISSVVVGVTGAHVSSENRRGSVAIPSTSAEIREQDVQLALENARGLPVPEGREIIHVIPRGFGVDGQAGVRQPVGMSGSHLEVETHIITVSSSSLENVLKSIELAGLQVDTVVLEPLATSEAVLTPAEKEVGVVIADIGGGTTDVAVIIDGAVAHSAIIPVGGNHVTADLAIGLKTSRAEAERLKQDHGCAIASHVSGNDLVDVLTIGGDQSHAITRLAIADIIQPRMQELFGLIRKDLKQHGYQNVLAGLVLSGGGSLLNGAAELAEDVMELPTRIGSPQMIPGCQEDLNSPVFATAVGLLYFGAARQWEERWIEKPQARPDHFFWSALKQLHHWFIRLFERQ